MPSCSFAEEPAWVTRRAGSESGTASQIEKAADACALELLKISSPGSVASGCTNILDMGGAIEDGYLDVLMWGGL
jgi:hypothetical protein